EIREFDRELQILLVEYARRRRQRDERTQHIFFRLDRCRDQRGKGVFVDQRPNLRWHFQFAQICNQNRLLAFDNLAKAFRRQALWREVQSRHQNFDERFRVLRVSGIYTKLIDVINQKDERGLAQHFGRFRRDAFHDLVGSVRRREKPYHLAKELG